MMSEARRANHQALTVPPSFGGVGTETAPCSLVAALRAAGCVFAEDEAELLLAASAGDRARLAGMLARRVAGEPLEVVVGWAEFAGRRILIDPGVFVPRRRTELMVRLAVSRLGSDPGPTPVLVDLCCGSGAVGLAVAAAVPGLRWYACDVDPAAVACARRNCEPQGGRIHAGDLFEALPARLRGRIDLVTANAPYVPTGEVASMPPEARLYEPMVSLDGGADGLDVQRRVIAAAPGWLRPGGRLLVESSVEQAATSARLMAAAGLVPVVHTDEEIGGTVVAGTLPARVRG